jgi:alpha-tubulin suppressor-like RCC1 family protein
LNHTACLSADGDVFVFGKYQGDKMMDTITKKKVLEDAMFPRKLAFPGKAVQMVCGSHHTTLLTEDGEMYSCGIDYERKSVIEPIKMKRVDFEIGKIFGGNDRTFAVSKTGFEVVEKFLIADEEKKKTEFFEESTPEWSNVFAKIDDVSVGWQHFVVKGEQYAKDEEEEQ